MPTSVWLVVFAMATARLVGLVAQDTITAPIRDAVERRWPDRWLTDLVSCAWCSGLWISTCTAAIVWVWGDKPLVQGPAVALAFSWFAGITSDLGRS